MCRMGISRLIETQQAVLVEERQAVLIQGQQAVQFSVASCADAFARAAEWKHQRTNARGGGTDGWGRSFKKKSLTLPIVLLC